MKIIKKIGFTLVEMMISTTILVSIFTITLSVYVNFSESYKYFLVRNEIFEETYYLFEQVVKNIKVGNIDYQSYWRENSKIKITENGTERNIDLFGSGPNIQGVKGDLSPGGNFNSIKNCSGATINPDHSDDFLPNSGNGRLILETYHLQFVYPGAPSSFFGNKETESKIHLNCANDFVGDDKRTNKNEKNIFDDDFTYGKGPKAFSGALSKEWIWSWNTEAEKYYLGKKDNKPPLFLLNNTGKKRTIFRHGIGEYANLCKNGTGCILMLELKVKEFDKEGFAKKWKCIEDYSCPEPLGDIISKDIKWKDITPSKIIVKEFDFFMGPEKPSFLSFNEKKYFKPSYITIKIGIDSSKASLKGIRQKNSIKINLQTTIMPLNQIFLKTFN